MSEQVIHIVQNSKNIQKNFFIKGIPQWLSSKESACQAGDVGSILDQKDPLEEAMATHSSILAWRIPWTEEPGRLHIVHRVAKSQTRLKQLSRSTFFKKYLSHS